jgi:hypothetical protein
MRNKDQIMLESIYQNLILEDAQSQINQSVNILKKWNFEETKKRKGGKIPPEEFENFKLENQKRAEEIVNSLKQIIDDTKPPRDNPNFGKGYEFLPDLSRFFTQGLDENSIKDLYNSYSTIDIPTAIKARKDKIIKNSDSTKFSTLVHSIESEEKNLKASSVDSNDIKKTSQNNFSETDENKVYEDENIVVFSATTGDFNKSIQNCRKYGQGDEHGLCISGSGKGAYTYYLQYRFRDGLSTYFVYFKKENKKAKEGFIIIDRVDHDIADSIMDNFEYQYNTVSYNSDVPVTSEDPIIKLYPELAPAFEQDVFKIIPLVGDELQIKDKVYNAYSIFDEEVINDPKFIQAFMVINNGSFYKNDKPVKVDDLEKLKKANPSVYEEIIKSMIELGEQMEEEVYDHLKPQQQKRWEVVRLRKIEQAFGINSPENNQQENQ